VHGILPIHTSTPHQPDQSSSRLRPRTNVNLCLLHPLTAAVSVQSLVHKHRRSYQLPVPSLMSWTFLRPSRSERLPVITRVRAGLFLTPRNNGVLTTTIDYTVENMAITLVIVRLRNEHISTHTLLPLSLSTSLSRETRSPRHKSLSSARRRRFVVPQHIRAAQIRSLDNALFCQQPSRSLCHDRLWCYWFCFY
jgi:hypothetical protein